MTTAEPAREPQPQRPRRWRRVLWLLLLAPYPLAWAGGMEPALPFDLAINLGGDLEEPGLRPPSDGTRRLVVLQHGLWRTPWSLWRLERALRASGYDVVNPGYPSRSCRIEDAATLLHDAVERAVAAGPQPVDIAFVGHSMGGLVIEEYLRRGDARAPFACVYVAVPHHGAVLCDLRKHWWPFPLLLGDRAALQLSPGDAFHRQAIQFAERSGALVGDRGAGNAAIPGDDDGTVAVGEATLAGAADVLRVPLGHTAIAGDAQVIRQVLQFLLHRQFAR